MQINTLKVDFGDAIVLTFSDEEDIDTMRNIVKIWQNAFPHNFILANKTDLVQNITIIKKDDTSLW